MVQMTYIVWYFPYKKFVKKIKTLSKYKGIYRININDELVKNIIIDIFYSYNNDSFLLDKNYMKKWPKKITIKL